MKKCNRCEDVKLDSEFHKNKHSHDGLKSICRDCAKEGKQAKYPPSYYKDKKLQLKFGITLSEYIDMKDSQGYRCAICGIHEEYCDKQLAVDHCHTTGNVRGLLCQKCNTGLGQFKDNVEFLKKAIDYLEVNNG